MPRIEETRSQIAQPELISGGEPLAEIAIFEDLGMGLRLFSKPSRETIPIETGMPRGAVSKLAAVLLERSGEPLNTYR